MHRLRVVKCPLRLPLSRLGFLAALLIAGTIVTPSAVAQEPVALELGNQRQLFVNPYLIDKLDGLALQLQEPHRANTILTLDKPWEGNHNFGTAVFHHNGRYYLYYRSMPGENFGKHYGAVALSNDGITWTKPSLGLVSVNGTTDNNLVALENEKGELQPATTNLDFWLDANPHAPDSERFKLVTYQTNGGPHVPGPAAGKDALHVATFWVSEDGFRFRKREPQPQFSSTLKNSFDSFNVYFWSEIERQYVCYYRWYDTRRTIARVASKDLMTWTEAAPMTYGDTPREHLYTNATTPYFRAPELYISFPARFMEGRKGTMTEEQFKQLKLSNSYKERAQTFNNSPTDGVLMSTRAGSTEYDRTFMESFVRPGIGLENWVNRGNYPVSGIIQTGPAEMSFYVMRHYMQPSWHIERLTLRLDGFASLHAPYRGGEMVTKLFTFEGTKLTLNYATSAAGDIRVELQNLDGQPIPGFELKDAEPIIGDEISRTVTWVGNADVGGLAGKPIRLRLVMRDADLYSIRFE